MTKDISSAVSRAQAEAHAIPSAVTNEETGPTSTTQLVCVAGQERGRSFALLDKPLVIGRGDVDVALQATDVSRYHARIFRNSGRCWIEDLGSSNGTYVNGNAVQTVAQLHCGDRIRVGTTMFVYTQTCEIERRLRQIERLDAMNELVRGLAHDFNNTLQVFFTDIELLRARPPEKDANAILDEMILAANSASGLVRRIARIGREKPPTQDLVEVDSMIHDTVVIGRRLMPANIQVDIIHTAGVLVRGSRHELEQALTNALINARDAMPAGGAIQVEAKRMTLDSATAMARQLKSAGTYVEIIVRDSGTGMDDETRARAFEPFFTTKAGRGSGLGLAMLYSTIRSHGGFVQLESTVGEGTAVHMFLPALV